VAAALSGYPGLAHRLEQVATIDGIRYINDSKATNVAAVAQAFYFIVQKNMLSRYGALELTTVSTVCGCLMLSLFTPELIDAVSTAPRSASLVALYLGIGPSAGAYLGWAHIVSTLPLSRAVTLLYLVPVLAYLLGWAVLGETPSLLSVVGGIATIAGVALVHRRSP